MSKTFSLRVRALLHVILIDVKENLKIDILLHSMAVHKKLRNSYIRQDSKNTLPETNIHVENEIPSPLVVRTHSVLRRVSI